MRKEQKADLLLRAALHWQNGCVDVISRFSYPHLDLCDFYDPGDTFAASQWVRDMSASACLSEVAALGFDVEDA